jgi:hypothetical protein
LINNKIPLNSTVKDIFLGCFKNKRRDKIRKTIREKNANAVKK